MQEYNIYNTNCSLKVIKILFQYFISHFKFFNFAIVDLKHALAEVVGALVGSYAHELVDNFALELWFNFCKTGSLQPDAVMKSLKHNFYPLFLPYKIWV